LKDEPSSRAETLAETQIAGLLGAQVKLFQHLEQLANDISDESRKRAVRRRAYRSIIVAGNMALTLESLAEIADNQIAAAID
jgi:hypothetical protein